MAVSSIIALDLGAFTIKVAEFLVSRAGSLTLNKYAQVEYETDPGKETDNSETIIRVIRDLFAQNGIKNRRVAYAISGQSVFTKFIKLPPVENPDKIKQIIRYEAQQNVPFPIDQVVWDYQLVALPDSPDLEVVLLAVKSEIIEELHRVISHAGLKPVLADVSPMALYNAFRYNYDDLADCTLVVDIGGRTTNLIFVEGNKFFSRSLPIGGNTITSSIANELQVPFGEAETLKKTKGFVGLGGAYEEPSDPTVATLCKVIRQGMTKLHAEISRSVNFYRTQQGGAAPQRVLLSGGSSIFAFSTQFFKEKLNVEVEYLNPLRHVGVAPHISKEDLARSVHFLGEVVGLGLRQITECPVQINLEPPSVTAGRAARKRLPVYAGCSLGLIAMTFFLWLYMWRQYDISNDELTKVSETVITLEQFKGSLGAQKKKEDRLHNDYEQIVLALSQKTFWVGLMADLNKRIHPNLWITSFKSTGEPLGQKIDTGTGRSRDKRKKDLPAVAPAEGPSILYVIDGICKNDNNDTTPVDEFVRDLARSPYFEMPDSHDPTKAIVKLGTGAPGTEHFFPFQIRVGVRHPLAVARAMMKPALESGKPAGGQPQESPGDRP